MLRLPAVSGRFYPSCPLELTALRAMKSDLVKYATSADVSGDRSAVAGYAGMIFS